MQSNERHAGVAILCSDELSHSFLIPRTRSPTHFHTHTTTHSFSLMLKSSLSVSLSLSHTHTHTHTQPYTQIRTHNHTHTHSHAKILRPAKHLSYSVVNSFRVQNKPTYNSANIWSILIAQPRLSLRGNLK